MNNRASVLGVFQVRLTGIPENMLWPLQLTSGLSKGSHCVTGVQISSTLDSRDVNWVQVSAKHVVCPTPSLPQLTLRKMNLCPLGQEMAHC